MLYSPYRSSREIAVGRAKNKKKIDPRLLRQLDAPTGVKTPGLVEAVVQLHPEAAGEVVPRPERTEAIVRSVLARVTQRLRLDPADFNVFPHLGSFVVSASREYLRELLDQPEVQGALANRPGDAKPSPPSRRSPPSRKPSGR